MKILLVDDEKSLLAAMERVLVQMDHEVETAYDAVKAVRMTFHTEYDFAIVDYMMPGHDGIWFMKNARFRPGTTVLLMTGVEDRDAITSMFKLGASGFLVKPIDMDELCCHLDLHSSSQTRKSGSIAASDEKQAQAY